MEVCTLIKPALIIIPDISGFTKFMSEADLFHSQVKIASLLEAILESNKLGFTVSEIEGDAILFYDFENSNSVDDILLQCQLMQDNFTKKLIEFEASDCQCGSCSYLLGLKLKFIIHYGMLGSVMIGDYCKLYGKDLIVAHKLLKAKTAIKDHLLLTEAFVNQYSTDKGDKSFQQMHWTTGSELMDDIGLVRFKYSTFK